MFKGLPEIYKESPKPIIKRPWLSKQRETLLSMDGGCTRHYQVSRKKRTDNPHSILYTYLSGILHYQTMHGVKAYKVAAQIMQKIIKMIIRNFA